MGPGDLFWVEFPIGAGRAQAGRRPGIVLQAPEASEKLPTVLLVPLTTQQEALRFPGTILVEPDPKNGLHHPSVALVFQLTVIDRRFLGQQLGTVSPDILARVWSALDEITGRR